MKSYLLFILVVILSCSKKKENKAYQIIQIDTLPYGSYYGTSIEDVWGKYHFQTTTGEELAWFPNDTTFHVKVELDGLKDYPLKLVSINKNIEVTPLEAKFNSFRLFVNKQIDEKDKFDAKLAVLSDTSSKIYIFHQRNWIDSSKSKYEEQFFRIDTIAKENIKIKERVLTPH